MVQQPMTIEALTLNQLLSPSFPVGAFAYSHGLETAIQTGQINDAESLHQWLGDLLAYGTIHTDAVLLNIAYDTPAADVLTLDATARAYAVSAERLKETDLQGAAFCDAVRSVWGLDIATCCYPVAVGYTAALLSLDCKASTALYLQSVVANLCAVAMRLVPLGQVAGQTVQQTLIPICVQTAESVQGASLLDIHGSTWASDIAAMQHETLYSRVFRT